MGKLLTSCQKNFNYASFCTVEMMNSLSVTEDIQPKIVSFRRSHPLANSNQFYSSKYQI